MVQGNELGLGFWFLRLKKREREGARKTRKKSEQVLCFVEIARVFSVILL